MTQLTIGFLLGLLIGMSLRQLRPLVMLLIALAVCAGGYLLWQGGLPVLAGQLNRIATEARAYSAFFASLAIGKLIGGALAARR